MTSKTAPTFDFDLPVDRFDDEIANSGRWEVITDENGTKYGEFLITLQDDSNQRYKVAKKRYFKVNQHRLQGLTELERHIDLFVNLPVLRGWKGIKMGGKDVDYSKEAAIAYLNHPKFYYVIEQLWPMSHDVLRFQKEGEVSKDEEAGN
jgi:hypothetical protein